MFVGVYTNIRCCRKGFLDYFFGIQLCMPDQHARSRQSIAAAGTDGDYAVVRLDDVSRAGNNERMFAV